MIKINELLSAKKLEFIVSKWNLSQSSMIVVQLCKSLSIYLKYVMFMNNFFINFRLFKALQTLNIDICGIIKMNNDYSLELIQIKTTATKQKNRRKMSLMTIKSNEKINVDETNIFCMKWVDLNTVQYMTRMHTIEEIKVNVLQNAKRRRGVSTSFIIHVDEVSNLFFSALIVEYNFHRKKSDDNAQQQTYYFPH